MELLSPILKKLKQEYGYDFKNIIGHGSNGVTWDLGGNRVMKITREQKEMEAASLIKGKVFKNVVRIYRVFTVKNKNFKKYYIEEEKLTNISANEENDDVFDYLQNFHNYKKINLIPEILQKSDNKKESKELLSKLTKIEMNYISFVYMRDSWKDTGYELAKLIMKLPSYKKMLLDLVEGLKELHSIGLNHFDIHRDNIMKRKNDYVFVDIVSNTVHSLSNSNIEILEQNSINNKQDDSAFLPLEKRVIHARSDQEKYQGLRNIPLEDWSGMMIFHGVNEGDHFVGKDCLFDIRIIFLNENGKIISLGIITKDTGLVIAPKGTQTAVETAADDDYKFIPGNYFRFAEYPSITVMR